LAAVAASANTKAIAGLDMTGFSSCARHQGAAIRLSFGHRRGENRASGWAAAMPVFLLIRLKLIFFGLGCGRIQSDRTGQAGKAQEPVPIGAGCHENSQRNRGLGFKITVAGIVLAFN
jgi:hypothetical protein